jgi:hypothetical protein
MELPRKIIPEVAFVLDLRMQNLRYYWKAVVMVSGFLKGIELVSGLGVLTWFGPVKEWVLKLVLWQVR